MTDRETMQQALDALNLPSLKTQQMLRQRDEAIATLRAALEQFEKEPYAEQSRRVAQETQGRMRIDPVTGDVGIGTPPPQRQPLTDKEIVDAIQHLYQNRAVAEMAVKVGMEDYRAIEAAHGIKGEA